MAEKRLLCIVGSMNAGGAETFLMKVYRKLDRSKYQMDFAVAVSEEGYYDEEILSLGGRIYHIVPKSRGMIRNFTSICSLVRENKYQYVLRNSQHSLSALELLAAKLGGAERCIYRSSNSDAENAGRLHRLCMFMPRFFANVRIAPSTEAAQFMFGKNSVASGRTHLIHNAVDLHQFWYDKTGAAEIRQELGIEGKMVIGHVGRLNVQKNHGFLLEVFSQIAEQKPNAVLLLVGKGELEPEIREKAKTLGIADRVIFTGVRSDIPQILSAMDVFVFPSLYEGMPNTVIEAQATGLPCVIADTITREADITGLVEYLPLSDPEHWAKVALEAAKQPRRDTRQDFLDHRYDIQSTVEDFVKLCFGEN